MKKKTLKKVLIVSLVVLAFIAAAGVAYMAFFNFAGIIAVAAGVGAAVPVLCELARTDKAISADDKEEQ